jgi:NAD(P)-dependent dehydrogenase (short-subunit alcohol dehydrogenase family)
MRAQGGGTIVNVGSVDDRLPLPGIGAYGGSKFALAGLSGTLRQEVADQGVEVVLVEPGLVATAFYDRARESLPTARTDSYERLYRVLERIGICRTPLPGVCEPSAVADTVLTAATADTPKPRYQAGPLGKPGVSVAASSPAQCVLEWVDNR